MADEKIIQAAAEAIANRFYAMEAGEAPGAYIEPNTGDMDLASAVVAAIEPLIREQIAKDITELQHAQCCYGTREGDGRTCDCKFGGFNYGEVTGCAEYRTAARIARGDHHE